MEERATGFVLRVRPYTETSVIVNWFTREFGRVSTLAKGARRDKSPFRGKLDSFYHAELSFQRARRSQLHTLREVSVLRTHPGLRTDLRQLQRAAYVARLLEQNTESDTPAQELYELLDAFLRSQTDELGESSRGSSPGQLRSEVASPLDPKHPVSDPQRGNKHPSPAGNQARPTNVLIFEIKLLHELGLAPRPEESKLSPAARIILEKMGTEDWPFLMRLKLSTQQFRELNHFLHGFLISHLGRIPEGRNAALDVRVEG